MTGRDLGIQSNKDNRSAIFLMATFAFCLSAPELTDIRRPFHDTVGLFYGRIFMNDAVHSGSLPLWYPYARYSIPYYSLEGGMGWSPIGFLVGALAPYNLLSWAVEGFLWNIICLGGAFMFARGHVSSPLTAAAVAMTYAASGLMAGSVQAIGTTRAFQIGPWAFVAIDTLSLIGPQTHISWLRGTTIFAITGTLWLTSGYPGIWLTAPILVAPYAIMATRGRLRALGALGTGATIGGLLALGMCFLLVDGTFNSPFFGEIGNRPAFSPADGALEFRSLIHTFLANPGYLQAPGSGDQPLYMGSAFLVGLFMLWKINILQSKKIVLIVSNVFIALSALMFGETVGWPLIFFGIVCLAFQPSKQRVHTHADWSLLGQAVFATCLASRNSMGDLFRAYAPPFTMVRWNEWYFWVASLCIIIYAWRNIEINMYLISWNDKISYKYSLHSMFKNINHIMIFLGIISVYLGIYLLHNDINIDYVVHQISYIYLLITIIVYFITFIILFFLDFDRLYKFIWVFLFTAIPLFSGIVSNNLSSSDDQSHRIGIQITPYIHLLWDIFQITIIPILIICILTLIRHKITVSSALKLISTFVAVDMSLASPRVLSHAEYLRSGQINRPTSVDREFSFIGNERQPNESTMSTGSSLYNAFKKSPDQLKILGAQPQMEAYDAGAGSPSPFGQFVWFPKKWSLTVPSNRDSPISESLAELPGQPWPPAGASTISAPDCGDTQPGESSGRISKLLPDRVVATIQADCARLVVLMDTWAPGWTVSVDGKPTQPIRVNGVLRGVEVPAGDHTIMWFYRPVHWTLIVAVTIGSLLITIALGLASVVLTRGRRVPLT